MTRIKYHYGQLSERLKLKYTTLRTGLICVNTKQGTEVFTKQEFKNLSLWQRISLALKC